MTYAQTPRRDTAPRFEVRFRNGIYHIFDRVLYRPVATRTLKRYADEAVAQRNSGDIRHA